MKTIEEYQAQGTRVCDTVLSIVIRSNFDETLTGGISYRVATKNANMSELRGEYRQWTE